MNHVHVSTSLIGTAYAQCKCKYQRYSHFSHFRFCTIDYTLLHLFSYDYLVCNKSGFLAFNHSTSYSWETWLITTKLCAQQSMATMPPSHMQIKCIYMCWKCTFFIKSRWTIQLSKNHFIHTYHLVTLYLSIENFEKSQHEIYPYLGMLILWVYGTLGTSQFANLLYAKNILVFRSIC